MKRLSFLKSIYARTLFRVAFAILIIFIILGTIYFALFISASRSQETNYLRRNAEEISLMVSRGMNFSRTAIDSSEIPSYISLTASSTDALVWLVNADGEIIYNTGIPVETFSKLDEPINDRQFYCLPFEAQNHMQIVYSQIARQSEIGQLLPQNHSWMVASAPLLSFTGAYAGEILLLRSVTAENNTEFLQNYLVPISFLIAFFLALVVILLLSREITRPISVLADTADRVYKGDLSARVPIPSDNLTDSGDDDILDPAQEIQDDDLVLLMRTFNMLIAKFEVQEKDRSDFMSSISHDLRSPITSIRGFVEGMLDGTIPEEEREHYLKIVQQESKRLQKLVNELFEMTTILRKGQMKMGVFDINELIEDVLDSHETQLQEKNISVQLELTSDERSLVIGNDESIQRVLVNILANAIRFCPQDGLIKISSNITQNDLYQLVIEDNGMGLSDEDVTYVFDRFYKADKARNSEGSGLGLYIARNIINAHGQAIEAGHSKLGGARFTFTLNTP
mgnify:CR=1 FL=1